MFRGLLHKCSKFNSYSKSIHQLSNSPFALSSCYRENGIFQRKSNELITNFLNNYCTAHVILKDDILMKNNGNKLQKIVEVDDDNDIRQILDELKKNLSNFESNKEIRDIKNFDNIELNKDICEMIDVIIQKLPLFQETNFDELFDILNEIKIRYTPFGKDPIIKKLMTAIDIECSNRTKTWNIETILIKNLEKFVYLHVDIPSNEFINKVVKKNHKKITNLSKENGILLMKIINICKIWRSPYIHVYEMDYFLEKYIDEMNINEIAICSVVYMETNKHILNNENLVKKILDEFLKNFSILTPFNGMVILHVMAYSSPFDIKDYVKKLNKLVIENNIDLDWISKIMLINMKQRILDKEFLNSAALKFIDGIHLLNVSVIEDFMKLFSFFHFNLPEKNCIYKFVLNEIFQLRLYQLFTSPKRLSKIICYCSNVGVYKLELIDIILSKEFLNYAYGKRLNKYSVPYDILLIHCNVKIDHPDYRGNFLDQNLYSDLYKFSTEKPDAPVPAYISVLEELQKYVDEIFSSRICHVIPHFAKQDLIFSTNNEILNFPRYDIIKPIIDDEEKWFCIIPIADQKFDSTILFGNLRIKKRLLEKLGYKVIIMFLNSFSKIPENEKKEYLKKLILE